MRRRIAEGEHVSARVLQTPVMHTQLTPLLNSSRMKASIAVVSRAQRPCIRLTSCLYFHECQRNGEFIKPIANERPALHVDMRIVDPEDHDELSGDLVASLQAV